MRLASLRRLLALLCSGLLLLNAGPRDAAASLCGVPTVNNFAAQALSPAVVMMSGSLKPVMAAARQYRLFAAPGNQSYVSSPWIGIAVHSAVLIGGLLAIHAHPSLLLAALIPGMPLPLGDSPWPQHHAPYTGVWIDEFVVTDKDTVAPIAVTSVSSPDMIVTIYDPVIQIGALAHFGVDYAPISPSVRTIFDALDNAGSDLSELHIQLVRASNESKGKKDEIIKNAFLDELKRRGIRLLPTIQTNSALQESFIALDTVRGSVDFLPSPTPGVPTDALSAVQLAIVDSVRRKGFSLDTLSPRFYQRPTPPHHSSQRHAEAPPTGQSPITTTDFSLHDSLAVSHLLRELHIIVAEIDDELSRIDDQSELKELISETRWAFQDVSDALSAGIDQWPEAIFVVRNTLGHLVGIHLLEKPSKGLANPNFSNALTGTAVVRQSSQGRGIGAALTVRAMTWAQEHGFDYFLALIHKENQPSIRHFFKAVAQAGFTRETILETDSHLTFVVRLRQTVLPPLRLQFAERFADFMTFWFGPGSARKAVSVDKLYWQEEDRLESDEATSGTRHTKLMEISNGHDHWLPLDIPEGAGVRQPALSTNREVLLGSSRYQFCVACLMVGTNEQGEPILEQYHFIPSLDDSKERNGFELIEHLRELLKGLKDVQMVLSPRDDTTRLPDVHRLKAALGLKSLTVLQRDRRTAVSAMVTSKGVALLAYNNLTPTTDPPVAQPSSELNTNPNFHTLVWTDAFTEQKPLNVTSIPDHVSTASHPSVNPVRLQRAA